jgi:hypothetical protein
VLNGVGYRLTVRFGDSERFWKARRLAQRAYFATAGRLFSARYATAQAFTSASALRFLLARTAIPVLLACVLIGLLALLAGPGDDLAKTLGLGALDEDAYNVLLESIAAVTGVFLALYFTAVSAVAATVYASVPHDIRTLIVRDRLGNVYVQGVAFTMALAILLLALHAVGGSALRLALPVVAALAVFSIFAFIRLGQRAFFLADPTRLADTLVSDFMSWFKRSKYGGWRWDVPAFQDHYRQQARRSASSLSSLVEIASEQSHLRGESSRQLIRRIGVLLSVYLADLHEVPTESRWFGQRYEHRQWYLAGSTELEMATNTESSLQPKTVPDSTWVEDKLLGPLVAGVLNDVRRKDMENAVFAMESFPALWERFGAAWASSEGLRWAKQLSTGIVDVVAGEEFKAEPRSPLIAGLLDVAAMLPMHVELGLNRVVDDIAIPALGKRIRESDWSTEGTPYDFALSSSVLRAMEEARSGVAFERAADAPASTRTPGWYIEEVAFYAFEKDLKTQLDPLVEFLCEWYPSAADRLIAAGKYDAAAAVLSRGLEVVWKLERHVYRWHETVDAIRAEGERVDFNRPEWTWDTYHQAIRNLRIEVLERLARLIPPLALQARRDDIPDFFGYAVHRTGEACYEALAGNDGESFGKLFPTYFLGTLVASERVKAEVTDLFPQQAITWMFEPIVDCLELSGYAYIYSELHDNPNLSETCSAAWEKYLAEDGEERLKRIAVLSAFEQTQFTMTPRSVMRTRWQMALGNTLEEMPRDDEAATDHPFGHRPVKHQSRLIRRIAPDEGMLGSMLLHNARDVFIQLFLAKQDGAEDLDFGVADWVGRELVDEDDEPESEEEGADG